VAIILCLVLILISAGCSSPSGASEVQVQQTNQKNITIVDALGNTTVFSRPAQRIVCQNGLAAEMLVAIGAGDRIVGLSDYSMKTEYLKKQIPNARSIGDTQTPSIETIAQLNPDVVIVLDGNSKPKNFDSMRALNISVIAIGCYRTKDLPNDARTLGKLTGNMEQAERYARFSEQYITLVQERIQNISDEKRLRIYCEASVDYYAWGPGSLGDDLIHLLNAKNIAENLTYSGYVSPEWVIDQNPDVIIRTVAKGNNLTDEWEKVVNRTGADKIRAVRDHRVYVLHHDMENSPRGVVGLLYLAKQLYPEQFSDINPDAVLREYAEEFVPGSDEIEKYYPPMPTRDYQG